MFSDPIFLVLTALLAINIVGFILVLIDKLRSKKLKWRIPEKVFFIISALGGCIGIFIAMLVVRHKTKHLHFMLGIPIIFLIQIAIVILVLYNL